MPGIIHTLSKNYRVNSTYKSWPVISSLRTVIMIFLVSSGSIAANSPDFESMTGNLNLSQKQISYLDLSLTNLSATEEDAITGKIREKLESEFKDALLNDHYSNMYLLQSNYNTAHDYLEKSRHHLHEAYVRAVEYYMEESDAFFKAASPMVLRTRDADAGYFFRAGYKNLGMAKRIYTIAYNTYPGNDVNKIESYREAIRYVRLARRNLMLAIINANLPRSEKPSHRYISYKEAKKLNAYDEEYVSFYERIRYLILRLVERKLLARDVILKVNGNERRINILDIHRDNYEYPVISRESVRRKLVNILEKEEFDTSGLRPQTVNSSDAGSTTAPVNATQPASSGGQ